MKSSVALLTLGPRILSLTNLKDTGGEDVSILFQSETPPPRVDKFAKNWHRDSSGEGWGGGTTTADA